MKVSIDPADGWAAKQMMAVQLRELGYAFTEWIVLGKSEFEITG
jgi:hypothetical protein